MDAKQSKIIVRDNDGSLIQILPEVKVSNVIDSSSSLPVTSSAVANYGQQILSEIVKEVQYSSVEPTTANTADLDNGSFIFWEQTSEDMVPWTPVYTSGTQTITGEKTFTSTISGSIDGNATTATRASQDALGNDIASTYAAKSEMPTVYAGATSSSNGTAGLVPSASIADRNKYLKGDGTWAELTLPSVYQGATASSNGISGLVPAAKIADRNKYLKGDGTWAELTLPSDYVGATSSANGVHGLVPAANSSQRKYFFCADGSWSNINFGDTIALSGSQINPNEGNVFTKTITAATTFTIASIPQNKASLFNLILVNGGSKTIVWPSHVKWSDGIPPALSSSGTDVLTFLTPDGGITWYGTPALIGAM